jgi:cation:H+ antiporter
MALSALTLVLVAADGMLTRLEGGILLFGALVYTAGIVASTRRARTSVKAEFAREFSRAPMEDTSVSGIVLSILLLIGSIAVVVKGADWLVHGASDLARSMGVSDAFIGLTFVAIGTSSPELVTTVISTLRNERDIAIGNLIGSSVYNILMILGITALVPAGGIAVEQNLILIDIPVSGLVALICIPIFFSSRTVTRLEGASFVGAYILYLTYLVVLRS